MPFLLSSADAWAWGLATHVYFAQLLLWSVPLLDRRFRGALLRFPQLVLAGACLPDLALFGRRAGTRAFDRTHQWATAEQLLRDSRDDGERALALGFSSHLLVDVIAHNHFVPFHEAMWLDVPVLTHAVSEWAMDHHLAADTVAGPRRLLAENLATIARFASEHFGCRHDHARRAAIYLARGDAALRLSGIPRACHRWAHKLDTGLRRRLDFYVAETSARLADINRLLAGERPAWEAEVPDGKPEIAKPEVLRQLLAEGLPLPLELYNGRDSAAIAAPTAAPASTSLG
ncbi:MAG TPA: zinc dependent phospholipase C family protein [Burkholderiales bacterium]|nr:zinc dependent phospholipase C family protein [Burkholderiales bacterium]